MRRHGVRRLVALGAHGAGDSRDGSAYTRLVWAMRGHRMRDKETMEELIVAASGEGSIDATIVRPPALSDRPRTGRYQTGTDLPIGVTGSIARADLADFLLSAAITGS